MIEFAKVHYFEVALVIIAIYLLLMVKRIARKVVGIVFSLAAIARIIVLLINHQN